MELSDDRYEHWRTSAYTHVPKKAGQPKIFAGNFIYKDAWGQGVVD